MSFRYQPLTVLLIGVSIATACLTNYMNLVRQWFGVDFSRYNIFLMPLAFVRDFHVANAVTLNAQEKRLMQYLEAAEASTEDDEPENFSLAVRLDLKLHRTSGRGDIEVRTTNSPDALAIRMEEEDIRDKHPWDYNILTSRLQKRFADFKVNKKYHDIRKSLEVDERFCKKRLLDPANPKGLNKNFYNPNILRKFDEYYKKANKTREQIG